MRMIKKISIILCICCAVITLVPLLSLACIAIAKMHDSLILSRMPYKFGDTIWSSKDGVIELFEEEEAHGYYRGTEKSGGRLIGYKTNMYAEINIEGEKYSCYVECDSSSIFFISKDIPAVSEEGKIYETYKEHILVICHADYKSKKHFVAKVTSSKIPEIEVGEKIHFYRTDYIITYFD